MMRQPTLALAVIEAGLRIAERDPASAGQAHSVRRFSDDPDIAYALAPNSTGTQGNIEVSINSHGFRDIPYAATKPDGVFRILAAGDSVTFGQKVAAEISYPKKMEGILAERNVEVWNLGVGGYDTINEAAMLERHGPLGVRSGSHACSDWSAVAWGRVRTKPAAKRSWLRKTSFALGTLTGCPLSMMTLSFSS